MNYAEEYRQISHPSFKRSRSPELKLAQLRKAGGYDDVLTDNLRSQKRYLSQVRACSWIRLLACQSRFTWQAVCTQSLRPSLLCTVVHGPPTAAQAGPVALQAMATDIDRLNMAGPASPAQTVSMNHSSDRHKANDASLCSSGVGMNDDSCQLSTATSKRQRLSPLEVPEFPISDLCNDQPHRLSESGHMNGSHHMQSPHGTPQAQRFKDMYDKPPVSPNDPCFGMDLRKAALLRSLMLATEAPTSEAEHSRIQAVAAAKKGKRKTKQVSKLTVLPVHNTDIASMDLDCKSDRSSVSPHTASSSVLAAPLQYLGLPLQNKQSHHENGNKSLLQVNQPIHSAGLVAAASLSRTHMH